MDDDPNLNFSQLTQKSSVNHGALQHFATGTLVHLATDSRQQSAAAAQFAAAVSLHWIVARPCVGACGLWVVDLNVSNDPAK